MCYNVVMTADELNEQAAGWGLRARAGAVEWQVRATPRAARNVILGQQAGATRIALTAPPVEGAANAALADYIAAVLGVSKRQVRLVHGSRSRSKLFQIEGVELDQALRLLQAASKSQPGEAKP